MKVLLIPFAPSLAHVTRCLSMADTLKGLGADCVFAIGSEGRNLVEGAGYDAFDLPEISSEEFRNVVGWRWLSEEYLTQNLSVELDLIDRYRPDAVVYDFRFTTRIACALRNTRSISIVHGNVLSLIFDGRATAGKIIAGTGGNPVRRAFLRRLFPRVFSLIVRRGARDLNRLLSSYSLPRVKSPFEMLLGDVTVVADVAEFVSPALMDDEQRVLIGPLLWDGWSSEKGFDLGADEARRIVYVTMGSTVEARGTLVRLLGALSGTDYLVVASVGGFDLSGIEFGENIRVFKRVPGNLVAAASSLVIFHGGHETLLQALSCGVPSVVIPSNPDQILVGQQVEECGLGRVLRSADAFPMSRDPLGDIESEGIRDAVSSVIDDEGVRVRCREFSARLPGYAAQDVLRRLGFGAECDVAASQPARGESGLGTPISEETPR